MRILTERVVAFRDARDWSQFHGLKDQALSLLIEAGELAEHMRWHDDATLRARIAANPEPVADELADVLYFTLLLAHDLGIDLEEAFARKMAQNERKYPVEVPSWSPGSRWSPPWTMRVRVRCGSRRHVCRRASRRW